MSSCKPVLTDCTVIQTTLANHLLAKDDAVLQPLLEVLSNRHAGDLLDPVTQLFLLLQVILLSDLRKRNQSVSVMTTG